MWSNTCLWLLTVHIAFVLVICTLAGSHSIYLRPNTAVSGVGVPMAGDVVALLICAFKVIRWFCYRLS